MHTTPVLAGPSLPVVLAIIIIIIVIFWPTVSIILRSLKKLSVL